jgi:hypothetical protein
LATVIAMAEQSESFAGESKNPQLASFAGSHLLRL